MKEIFIIKQKLIISDDDGKFTHSEEWFYQDPNQWKSFLDLATHYPSYTHANDMLKIIIEKQGHNVTFYQIEKYFH